MSEINIGNMFSKLENMINDALMGDTLKNALDFAEYLRQNGMIYTGTHCEISYKNQCACYIYIDVASQAHGPWTIWTEGEYCGENDLVPIGEHMKEIAWANISTCLNCGNSCSPGNHKMIFGKDFSNVCNAVLRFRNPDAVTLECVKKLVEIRRHVIDDMECAE